MILEKEKVSHRYVKIVYSKYHKSKEIQKIVKKHFGKVNSIPNQNDTIESSNELQQLECKHQCITSTILIVINFIEGNDKMLENEMLDPEDEILDGPDPEDEIHVLDPETNDDINLTVWFTYDVPSLICNQTHLWHQN